MLSARVLSRWATRGALFGCTLGVAVLSSTLTYGAGPSLASSGGDDELARLNGQIIKDPRNTELNLRYARLAEARREWRWALAAYERILVNDPGNVEAQAGLQRIRLKLQPNVTQFTAELGTGYESNPRELANAGRGTAEGQAAFSLKDERALGDIRWRSTAAALGQVYQNETELNYAYLGGTTGPLLSLGPGLTWHPAIGAAATVFDNRFFYGEVNASITLEDYLQGLYRGVQLRVGYRDYDHFFPSHQGFYADVVGRWVTPVGQADVVIVSPWVRWSAIDGSIVAPALLFAEIQPGGYLEGGGRLEIYHNLFPWLVIGGNLTALGRVYRTDLVPFTTERRRDVLLVPGASAVFPNLLAYHADLRIDYRYLFDASTDPARSFIDHVITTTVATRF